MTSLTFFAPGREGIDIGKNTQALTTALTCPGQRPDIGVLSPRRFAAATGLAFRSATGGASSHVWKLAGRVHFASRNGRPALFLRAFEGSDGVQQLPAGLIGGEAGAHAGLIWSAAHSAAGAAACHGARDGRGAP